VGVGETVKIIYADDANSKLGSITVLHTLATK